MTIKTMVGTVNLVTMVPNAMVKPLVRLYKTGGRFHDDLMMVKRGDSLK